MNTESIHESPVWKEFETEVKKRRRNPVKFALDLLKEQIEIWEDEKLDEEIRKDAQKKRLYGRRCGGIGKTIPAGEKRTCRLVGTFQNLARLTN